MTQACFVLLLLPIVSIFSARAILCRVTSANRGVGLVAYAVPTPGANISNAPPSDGFIKVYEYGDDCDKGRDRCHRNYKALT